MEIYDFDKIIDRAGTGALKTDALLSRYGSADLLPLWVADMDFETPPFVLDAIRERLAHPIFGYSVTPSDYFQSIADWLASHHNWRVEREWLSFIPGVVKGLGAAVNALVAPDEKVIIQPPVYHPFRFVVLGNGRTLVNNPLRERADGSYEMDFENLAAVADAKCRMLILSNPHNPGGIVWSRETLARLADFCASRGIIVVSDEIHCDMTLWDNVHVPFASVSAAAAENSITFSAPSKTFNLAGIVSSYAVVPGAELRRKFYKWMSVNEVNEDFPIFSALVSIAAFRKGEEWRRQMLRYVEANIDFVCDFCSREIPQIRVLRPQASFLVWLDCRALGLNHGALVELFVGKAKLALNDGEMFGPGGEGFMRLNVGTPRAILVEALSRLKKAVREL